MNKVIRGEEARQKIVEGADLLADAVGSTLGPLGRNVGIDKGPENVILHDGVSVAKYVDSSDPAVKFGIGVLRQAANKQVDEVGDGTTVTTILGHAIIKEAYKVTSAGVNPMSLRRDLELAAGDVIDMLSDYAMPVKTLQEKVHIATVSAEDPELGKMIGETLDKLGLEGIITVEESGSTETVIEHQEGMQFDKGYLHESFITNPERQEATVENTLILLTNQNIVNQGQLIPLFTKLIEERKKNLVLIAPDITNDALAISVINKIQGNLNLLCIKAPQFNENQNFFLEDLAILTGGQVILAESGQILENVTLEQLGRARRVTSTKDATLIVGGGGSKEAILERVASLRSQLSRHEGSEFQQEKLRERIAKLSSGVAVIRVGGQTEIEMKERKERALDAVAATQAALEQGIVVGGEVVYLRAREVIKDNTSIGAQILYRALEQPFNRLMTNAGLDAGEKRAGLNSYLDEVKMGFDILEGQWKDMIEAGIVDPLKVCKSAISNAVSVAIQLLTTDTLIVPEIAKKGGE